MAGQVEQFGKYILLEKLAAGGMAEVYLSKTAGAVGVNKFVAIKRILPQYSGNQEFIEMFKEEAKICVNLNHSNVVSIFDFGMEKESFFLVMEFVPGKNLRQIINELKKLNKSFTTEQIVFIIKEVGAGLDHAHRCVDSATGRPLNITHRDMSPQNVMVSFEGEIKVIDFGIAKAETQLEQTKAGTLKGKFGYMSPEQAEGFPIDPRTDVFALGIVLWELLANDRLFTASNEAAILRKIRDCQIPPIRKINPAVPPELERIVNKALAKDKNLRYQTAANFHRDLNRFLNTQYPDFSPHDFSVFIKDCFSQHYIDQRNKLVDFAKIQFIEEKSNATSTNTATITNNDTSTEIANKRPQSESSSNDYDSDDQDEQSLDLDTKGNHKVSLEGLREQATSTKHSPTSKTLTRKPAIGVNPHTQFGTKTNYPNIPNANSGTSRPTIAGIPQPPRTSSALDGITNLLTKTVVSSILIFGGYFVFKSSPLQKHVECFIKTGALPCKELLPFMADPASTVKYGFTVYSDLGDSAEADGKSPEIYIDGVNTKYTTPARITVPGNKEFTLRLYKEGYVDYFKKVTVTAEGQSLMATMQKEKTLLQPKPTTISVTLDNSTGGEQIFINGVRLAEKLPLTNYAVQANTDIVIKVVNPYSNQVDQASVVLKPGESKIINFDFNRPRK